MALQAEERLILCQQVVCNRPMRVVTRRAALGNRSMFEDERTLVAGVTLETEIIGAFFAHQAIGCMWIVAIAAGHLAFLDWMMGREGGLGLLLLMTGIAKFRIFLLEGSFAAAVNGVAVVAANIAQSVFTVRPVHQLAIGVTLGTNRD